MLASRGDTYDHISVRADGVPGHRVLLSLRSTELPWFVDVGPDGSFISTRLAVRIPSSGFPPKEESLRKAPLAIDSQQVLPVADGRVILSTRRGKSQVLIGQPGSELRPLLRYRFRPRAKRSATGQPSPYRRRVISHTAVDSRGRVLLDVTTPSMWFYRAALLDTANGKMTIIPLSVQGDTMAPGWVPDGRIVSAGAGLTGALVALPPGVN